MGRCFYYQKFHVKPLLVFASQKDCTYDIQVEHWIDIRGREIKGEEYFKMPFQ